MGISLQPIESNASAKISTNHMMFLFFLELIPTLKEVYDQLPFASPEWHIKFNLRMTHTPNSDEDFVRISRLPDPKMVFEFYYVAATNQIKFRTNVNSERRIFGISTLGVDQLMQIEAESKFNDALGSWAWKVFVNGSLMVNEPHDHVMTFNEVRVIIGDSQAASKTDLQYSFTEHSGM